MHVTLRVSDIAVPQSHWPAKARIDTSNSSKQQRAIVPVAAGSAPHLAWQPGESHSVGTTRTHTILQTCPVFLNTVPPLRPMCQLTVYCTPARA